ncbi:MAG: hypothetical protein K2X87_10000 [Gemmataceae bacterium]|nr:hypothetical protein [Gemmataceae bacterium]
MDIPVVVGPAGTGYRARCRHPAEAEAPGGTRYEAVQALEAALKGRVPEPFALLPLEVTPDKPWLAAAGWLPDDDLTRQYLDAVAEHRRQCDARDQPPAGTDAA